VVFHDYGSWEDATKTWAVSGVLGPIDRNTPPTDLDSGVMDWKLA
jgi:hypothetical protein